MKLDNVIANRNNKTLYRDGNKCIKVFSPDYSKADVLNEALNQARIEETGLNIPKISEITMVDGKWAIVTEFIEGKTLAQLMEENPDKREEYLELLVDLQIEVQSKTCPLLNKLKDKMNRKISDLQEVDATTRYELHTRLKAMPKHTKVCHGDFNPSNIIIDSNGKAHILDWSHATQGNASADVARTYLQFCMKQPEIADTYLKLFCLKSNTAKQYVQHWIPIVAASHIATCPPEEKDFLMKWVKSVECEL
jgi:uncharacterized protein (TIGR02172 family)